LDRKVLGSKGGFGFSSVFIRGMLSALASSPSSIIRPSGDETDRLADVIEIVLFAFVGLGITWLDQQLHAARLRAEDALEQVRTLTGLLPICAWCKKIRDEEGR
jgi:hypothetical protein